MSLRDAADTILQAQPKQDGSYDTLATVLRTDGDTVWVHIDGGAPETPCKKTVECKAGESVMVRISGGSAWITGNHTSPSTDDTEAEKAKEEARKAAGTATSFITDSDNGIFVHPKNSTQRGVRVTDVVDIVRDGKTVAEFGEAVQIGEAGGDKTVAYIENDGLELLHGTTPIAHLGYGLGNAPSGTGYAPYYTLGERSISSTIGNYSTAEGYHTTASGYASHAEGSIAQANGAISHAEGERTQATGNYSHAEGSYTKSLGMYCHAEGSDTTAGDGTVVSTCAHAEGEHTTASGPSSHAEGYYTTASGQYSHAEGYYTTASGQYSHAQNYRTTAGYDRQTAIGMYNNNKSTNVFEIGWGTESTPKNILEVDTDGNLECTNVGAPVSIPTSGTGAFVVERTSGNSTCTVREVKKSGNMMMVSLSFKCTAAYTTNGSNLFVGTIPTKYAPAMSTTGTGYIGNVAVIGQINHAGQLTIRPCGALANAAEPYVYFHYFI